MLSLNDFCIISPCTVSVVFTMEWPDRWNHLRKILERNGPFSPESFKPGSEVFININKLLNAYYKLTNKSDALYNDI